MVDSNYAVLAGQKLRKLRKEARYTVGEFARLSKCKSEQQLYRYERGLNRIDLDTLVLCLRLLDADIRLFFDELASEKSDEMTENHMEL